MFVIIIENNDPILISKIEYIFLNHEIKIINKKDLLTDNIYNDYLFINKFAFPIKNFINELNIIKETNTPFCFLSSCKNIFYVNKDNINIIDSVIDIKIAEEYNILFDSIDYNNIDHIIPCNDINIEYINLLKLYNISYDTAINYNIAYKAYEKFLKYIVKNNYCYNVIIFINNVSELNFQFYEYKFYRISIFHNIIDIDDLLILNNFCKDNNILCCYCVNDNINSFYQITLNRLLWFEKIIITKNINLLNFELLNEYHNYKGYHNSQVIQLGKLNLEKVIEYNNILLTDIISISSTDFAEISFFNLNNNITKDHIFDLIYDFIYINKINNSYIKSIKKINKDMIICNTDTNISNNNIDNNDNDIDNDDEKLMSKLLLIRDYNTIINKLNEQIKLNYNKDKIFNLLIKKFSISTLCKPEEELVKDLQLLTVSINNVEFLNTLLILLSNIKNEQIIKKLYIKIIKLTDENKLSSLTLSCFHKLLSPNMNEEEVEVVLDFINYLIKNENKVVNLKNTAMVLFINITKFMKKENITSKFNNIINKIFNVDDILNIDKLLTINTNENTNNIVLLHYLIFITTDFSAYYNTYDEFIINRNKIEANIKYLLTKDIPKCSLEQVSILPINNFFLSYQGISSIEIFKLKSQLVRKICPDLNYKIDTTFKNDKINICFHSNFLNRRHSVYKDRHQIIKGLSENSDFNVYFSTFDNLNEDIKYSFGNATYIKLGTELQEIKKTLENLKLDILVYCEIGMDPKSYFMAHLKLAKIQINTWGHSDTSGIETIDYFFSSKFYELPYKKSQLHYSEKLILMDSLCTSYVNPMSMYNINTFKKRYEFGFTDEIIILFCAQSLFKFNPLYDDYIIQILQSNKNFVLIISNNDNKADVIKRFNNKNITSQIHIFPNMIHSLYLNVMQMSDIVLDPFPFGGCNSSFEAFSLNKVVVTQESNMINGRFTSGFYKKMKMDNMITKNKNDYIKLTLKLANDITYRNKIENKIKEKYSVLFDDKDSIKDWENLSKKLLNEKSLNI